MGQRNTRPKPVIVETVIRQKGTTWNDSTQKVVRTDAQRILEAVVAEIGVDATVRALDNQGFDGDA